MSSPVEQFAQLGLSEPLLKALTDVGYETPSPIQAACIPIILAGQDLLGMAQTGTGKTAAFALPILEKINLAERKPQALILTPTRELAIQVAEAFQRYAKHLPGFHVLPIYGGQSLGIQLRQLERGAHVIIGTPGRVMDHLERKSLNLDSLKVMALDEADEMLRMGFIDDVEWILERVPSTRQTALFSATMPEPIRRVAQKYLREPQEVKIKSATATVAAIRQRYWQVSGLHKLDALTRILEVEEEFDAAIIFVRTKTATEELAQKLEARGYAASALNGDMNQAMRERTIEQLKNGGLDIVIATDVAARGIDVPRVSHVINYDIPYDSEAYVHRIGRTGRAGRTGNAILFVSPREMRMLRTIERVTKQPIEPLKLPTKQDVADRRIGQFKQQVLSVLEAGNLGFFEEVVSQIEQDQDFGTHEIAAALAFLAQKSRPLQIQEKPGYQEDAPSPERKEKRSFNEEGRGERNFKDDRGERAFKERPPREKRERGPERDMTGTGNMVRYRIEVGRTVGATPKDIVGAIANEANLQSRFIGHIALFDEYSTVELPEGLPKDVLMLLKDVRVRQCPLLIHRLDGESEVVPAAAPRKRWGGAPEGAPKRSPRPSGNANGNVGSYPGAGPRSGGNKPAGRKPGGDWAAKKRRPE